MAPITSAIRRQMTDEPTLVHQSWEGKDMPCVGEQWVGRPTK